MNDILSKILDWPILVQGAVGSGLFWVFITIGQKIFSKISIIVSKQSNRKRRSKIATELARYWLVESGDRWDERNYHLNILIYRSLRDFYKAIIWLTLGLAISSIFSVFGVVGYIGCFIYLLSAANTIRAINIDEHTEDEKKALLEELNELEQKE